MKKIMVFLFASVLMALVFACTKDDDFVYSTDNEHIKSISMSGDLVHQYLYDRAGKIVEENSHFYFNRYIYENGRLIKIESAFDRSLLSSAFIPRRTEFMTSRNSTVDSYNLYEYDNHGRLSKIKTYLSEVGKAFEYRSMQTFEYEKSLIVRVNLHSPDGKLTQYHKYTYDKHGNVANEKHYSNLFDSSNELLSETTYKYDNYNNPFRIFSMSGSPGMYTNANNIIEISVIQYRDIPGVNKHSTYQQHYKYNSNHYPVKLITPNSEESYQY